MTILVFYPVENALGWERHDFDCMTDEAAFNVLWANQDKLYARFYDMDSHYGDRGELDQYIRNADDFETDYNDEELDGGWWCKTLHVPSDYVKQVIESNMDKMTFREAQLLVLGANGGKTNKVIPEGMQLIPLGICLR